MPKATPRGDHSKVVLIVTGALLIVLIGVAAVLGIRGAGASEEPAGRSTSAQAGPGGTANMEEPESNIVIDVDDLPGEIARAEGVKQRVEDLAESDDSLKMDDFFNRRQAELYQYLSFAQSDLEKDDALEAVRSLREFFEAEAELEAYLTAREETAGLSQQANDALNEAIVFGTPKMAKGAFREARNALLDADHARKEGDAAAAAASYQKTIDLLAQAKQSIIDRVAAARAAAEEGFATGDSDKIRAAIQVIKMKDPADEEAERWTKQLDTFDQTWELLESARKNYAAGNLELAEGKLVLIEKEYGASHAAVTELLETVRAERKVQVSEEQLEQAAAAIQAGELRKAFDLAKNAQRLNPGNKKAGQLVQMLEQEVSEMIIEESMAEAAQFEAAGNWREAERAYRVLLRDYPSLTEAREGVTRARQGKRQMRHIERVLETARSAADRATPAQVAYAITLVEEHALSHDPEHEASQRLLAVLKQRQQLLLKPVPVTLTSDGRTTVTVWGEGEFKNLTRTTLNLKPGVYKIVGHRDGFRDVFKELVVAVDGEPMNLHIVCSN